MTVRSFVFGERDMATKLVAAGLISYYLIPFTIPFLHFSPHLLFFGASFLILLLQRKWLVSIKEIKMAPIIFFGVVFLILILQIFAINTLEIDYLRVWVLSLMTFFVVLSTFHTFLPKENLASLCVILSLWSASCITQVLFGIGYISDYFGVKPNVVYATGLSSFSNHGAVIMVPMLIFILVFNLDKINWGCCLIWLFGCVALYFTLSRAGWLALIVSIIVVSIRYRRNLIKLRNITLHSIFALFVIFLAWTTQTKVDSYEFLGDQSGGRWAIVDELPSLELNAISASGDYSTVTRFVTLKVAVKAISDHPLTGIGLGAFPSYYLEHSEKFSQGFEFDRRIKMTPHNGYLQFISEVGIPAFIAFIIWLGWIILGLSKRTDPTAVAIHASIFGVLSWMMFHDGLYERFLWILLGSAVALSSQRLSILRAR
jgi:O-antigen ligase